MGTSSQSEFVLALGRGSIVCTAFGAVWLGLSLAAARAFVPIVVVLFSIIGIALFARSLSLIRKGRALRNSLAVAPNAHRDRRIRKLFIWISIGEGVAIGLVCILGYGLNHGDLVPVGIAIVVGLHFLPLAKVFEARIYYWTGGVIVAWSIFSWVAFHSQAMDVSAGIGTGATLWLTATFNLLRSHTLVRENFSDPHSAAHSQR
jgi:hypothetical protein